MSLFYEMKLKRHKTVAGSMTDSESDGDRDNSMSLPPTLDDSRNSEDSRSRGHVSSDEENKTVPVAEQKVAVAPMKSDSAPNLKINNRQFANPLQTITNDLPFSTNAIPTATLPSMLSTVPVCINQQQQQQMTSQILAAQKLVAQQPAAAQQFLNLTQQQQQLPTLPAVSNPSAAQQLLSQNLLYRALMASNQTNASNNTPRGLASASTDLSKFISNVAAAVAVSGANQAASNPASNFPHNYINPPVPSNHKPANSHPSTDAQIYDIRNNLLYQSLTQNNSATTNGNSDTSGAKDSAEDLDDPPMVCMICSDIATGLHYGIITCEG